MKNNILDLRRKIEEVTRISREKYKKIIYVDFNGNLKRLNSDSNFVIYGRRGSGKTTLLIQSFESLHNILPIYIQCEVYKEHTYPNLLINILIQILEQSLDSFKLKHRLMNHKLCKEIKSKIKELRDLMNKPDDFEISFGDKEKVTTFGKIGTNVKQVEAGAGSEVSIEKTKTYTARQKKIDYLNHNLDDFRKILSQINRKLKYSSTNIYLDDFYHLNFNDQPFIADYILRLCKDISIYFKITTIKHRSNLYTRDVQKKIRGIQESAEHSLINLDFSLEYFDKTRTFLTTILSNLCKECNCSDFLGLFVKTENGIDRVIWASGGVPRDFLLIIGYIIDSLDLDNLDNIRIDKRIIDSAAHKLFQDKLQDLNSEYAKHSQIMQFYQDVYNFCIKYNKKTAFLIKEPNDDKELLEKVKNLMDHRLIHQVVSNMTLTKQHGSFIGFILDIGAYVPFLNIKKPEYRIKEINILRKDDYKKDTLVEFRALSLKNELSSQSLIKSKEFISEEKNRVKKTHKEEEYKDLIQKEIFDFLPK